MFFLFGVTGTKLRPTSLMLKSSKSRSTQSLGHIEFKESDFFALQATLQTEARIALAQAKEMARIQMEVIIVCIKNKNVTPLSKLLYYFEYSQNIKKDCQLKKKLSRILLLLITNYAYNQIFIYTLFCYYLRFK